MSALEPFDPSFVPLASKWLVTYLSARTPDSPRPTDFQLVIAHQSANGDFQGRAQVEDAQVMGGFRENRIRFLKQWNAVATEAPVYHEGILSDDGAALTGVWSVSGPDKLSGTWQAHAVVTEGQASPVWPPPPKQPETLTTPLPPPSMYAISRAGGTCLLITEHPQQQSLLSAWLGVLMLAALFAFMLASWGRFAYGGGIFAWGPTVSLGVLVVYGVVSTARRQNAVRYSDGFYFDRATGRFGRQAKPLGNLGQIRGVEVQPGPARQEGVFLVLPDEASCAVALGAPDNMAQIADAVRRFLSIEGHA